MNRLDRITTILIQLQSKKLVTASEMATRFGVSHRTIYRDIKTLQQAGVPIGVEEGRGYFIVDGYRLPPVMFTQEEANALLTAEKVLAQLNESSLQRHFSDALMKIRAVLRTSAKEKAEYLMERTTHAMPWAPASHYLTDIQAAITNHRVLDVQYHSKYKDVTTRRQFHAYALHFNGMAWVVIGYCMLRRGLREFRLDRIQELRVTEEPFTPSPFFNLGKYLIKRNETLQQYFSDEE